MSLNVPVLISQPASIHTLDRAVLKFNAHAEYLNYTLYEIKVNLNIDNKWISIQRAFVDGYVEVDMKEYLEPFFEEKNISESLIIQTAAVSYSFYYQSYTVLTNDTSSASASIDCSVFNIKFPDNLSTFLTENNMSIVSFTNIQGLLLNPLATSRVDLKTSYRKIEFFSFILLSPQTQYSIEYTLTSGVVEVQVVSATFEKDVIYTIPFRLEYSDVKSYKFKIGTIAQNYIVDSKHYKQSYCLVYVNSYNLLDSIELTGQAQQKAVLSKLNYFRSDVQKSYDNKYKFEYIFNTQYLSNTANFNLLECVNSKQVWLKIKGNWEELSLDISDFELSEDGVYFQTNEIKAITSRSFDRFLSEKVVFTNKLNSEASYSRFTVTDGFNMYSMFFRTILNPKTKVLVQCWKTDYQHTYALPYFFFRRSLDWGRTFRSADGLSDYNKVNLSEYVMNPTPFYTKEGRLIMFMLRCPSATTARDKAAWIYSDDDGETWSAIQYFTEPAEYNATKLNPAYFYSSACFYNANGELFIPYTINLIELGRCTCRFAKSSNNGQTWVDAGITLFQNTTGTKMTLGEFELVQDNNHIIMVARANINTNPDGLSVPAMFHSADYGATWKIGGGYYSVEEIHAKPNLSGFAYLEGAGVGLATISTAYNDVMPSINLVEILGEKWLVIFYWLRLTPNGLQQTVLKWTVVKLADYLTGGVNAIKNISQILLDCTNHDGPNKNGGNGCGAVFGEDIIYSLYSQETTTSNAGWTFLHTLIIRKSQIETLIDSYTYAF